MKKQEKLILMNKNHEVLSFLVDYKEDKLTFIEKLKYFNEAPFDLNEKDNDLSIPLSLYFSSRRISTERWDYKLILEATGCKNGFELSFKGHGLSLSNHYWFKREGENLKYEDINFFTNKWDDSFAKAVLRGDYEALKHCDLNIPDIVTAGWSVKGWIYDNGPKLIKLGIVKDAYEDCLGEVLGSKLAQRILKDDEVVKYELVKVGDKYASMCPAITGEDEELIPISHFLSPQLYDIFKVRNTDKNKNKEFFKKVSELGIPELYEFFVKLSVIRSIGFISDLHFENISIIRNTKTGKIRIAPIYDLAGAFGSSENGRSFITNIDKGGYLLIYFLFNCIEPDWDYSWYDPNKLVGFEKEIREILSMSSFYTPELIEKIIAVYRQQKESLDRLASQQTL